MRDDGYEIWGTYSVFDHLKPYPFVADVILFDRLVIPVVPKNPTKKESERWEKWDPKRLGTIRKVLGELAFEVPWGQTQHDLWENTWHRERSAIASYARTELAGEITAGLLLKEIPAYAKGIVAVTPYSSLEELKQDLKVREIRPGTTLEGGTVAKVIGHEFLVPTMDDGRDEMEILAEATEFVQRNDDFRMKRREFHASLQRFMRSGETDVASVKKAVQATGDELRRLQDVVTEKTRWTWYQRAFLIGSVVTTGLVAMSATGLIIASGMAAGIGLFTATEKLSTMTEGKSGAAALLRDGRRGLNLGNFEPLDDQGG